MSFIEIENSKHRDALYEELYNTKRNIKSADVFEKTGKRFMEKTNKELFKPITDESEKLNNFFTENLLPAIQNIPAIENKKSLLSIEEKRKEAFKTIGPIAEESMGNTLKKIHYGLNVNKENNFYIGDREVVVENNDILDDERFTGTKGLWNLLRKNTQEDATEQDKINYLFLMKKTNAIHRNNDPENKNPKITTGYKWNNLLRDLWFTKSGRKPPPRKGNVTGQGLASSSNALIDRLILLKGSKEAGNTSLDNEIRNVYKQLFIIGEITEEYDDLIL